MAKKNVEAVDKLLNDLYALKEDPEFKLQVVREMVKLEMTRLKSSEDTGSASFFEEEGK